MAVVDQPPIDSLLAKAAKLTTEVSGQAAGALAPPLVERPKSAPNQTVNAPSAELPPELRRILRLEVPVIVQLAERQMAMKEVLELNVGSIIEFYRPFDAELDLIVTNRSIGMGHAVKVGENFGLRITRVGSLHDTIKALAG